MEVSSTSQQTNDKVQVNEWSGLGKRKIVVLPVSHINSDDIVDCFTPQMDLEFVYKTYKEM